MVNFRIITTLLLIYTMTFINAQPQPRIYIGMLLESSRTDLQQIMVSANTAIEMVNQFKLYKIRMEVISRLFNSSCKTSTAPVIAAELYHEYNISALVGDFCDEALGHVAHLASSWNIPIITGSGANCIFEDKTKFKTLTRLKIGHCQFVSAFQAIFQQFSWSNITVISDTSDTQYKAAGNDINSGLKQKGYNSQLLPYSNRSNGNPRKLIDASKRSRVFIIGARPLKVHNFLKEAWKLGYIQSGQYVFLQYDLEPTSLEDPTFTNLDNSTGDLEMYDALMAIKPDFQKSKQVEIYTPVIVKRIHETSTSEPQITFPMGAIFDAITLYASAVNRSFADGNDSYRDGETLCRKYIWQQQYEGLSGSIFIDNNGDRQTNFSVNDLNMDNGRFEPVAFYDNQKKQINFVTGTSIHWPGPSNTPPLNEPKCWYNDDNPDCNKSDNYIATVVGYGALAVSVLILMCVIILTIGQICRRFIAEYGTPEQLV